VGSEGARRVLTRNLVACPLLRDAFPTELSPYQIIGAPTDLQGAEALKELDT